MIIETEFKTSTITSKHHTISLTDKEAGAIENFLYEQIYNVKAHNVPQIVQEFQLRLKKGVTLNQPVK